MISSELENLVRIGTLKREPASAVEVEGLYVVFQTLPHTLGVPVSVWRLLAKCHGLRNQAEYEGLLEVEEGLVDDLVAAAKAVSKALRSAGPPAS